MLLQSQAPEKQRRRRSFDELAMVDLRPEEMIGEWALPDDPNVRRMAHNVNVTLNGNDWMDLLQVLGCQDCKSKGLDPTLAERKFWKDGIFASAQFRCRGCMKWYV